MKLDLAGHYKPYKAADGKRVPGVTTILGALDKSALVDWAARVEREEVCRLAEGVILPVPEGFADRLKSVLPEEHAHTRLRDKAADLGTITHARIEGWLRNDPLEPDGLPEDLYEKSIFGFERFREWWFSNGYEAVETEVSIVSEALRVGGKLDVVARDPDGKLVLVDIKTSNFNDAWPYPTVIGQAAGYAHLWEGDGREPIDRVAVARVGKEEGDIGTRLVLSDRRRREGEELFLLAIPVYRALQALARKER